MKGNKVTSLPSKILLNPCVMFRLLCRNIWFYQVDWAELFKAVLCCPVLSYFLLLIFQPATQPLYFYKLNYRYFFQEKQIILIDCQFLVRVRMDFQTAGPFLDEDFFFWKHHDWCVIHAFTNSSGCVVKKKELIIKETQGELQKMSENN